MKKLALLICSVFVVCGVALGLAGCNSKQFFCSHKYQEVLQEATCSQNGKSIRTCSKCGKVLKKSTPKLEHVWGETSTFEPTCSEMGYSIRICTMCGFEDRFDQVACVAHTWGETQNFDPTCTEVGYSKHSCQVCSEIEEFDTVPALGHLWGEWVTTQEATPIEDGCQQRTCSRCHSSEEQTILALSYIDSSILLYGGNLSHQVTASSQTEFNVIFGAAIFNRVSSLTCKITFVSTLSKEVATQILDIARDSVDLGVGYSYSASFNSRQKTITITFTHQSLPSHQTTSDDRYSQKNSLNLIDFESSRAEDFDDFKINAMTHTYVVSTTDQLFYCLERRVKPIPVQGSAAERIYLEMKTVLREIVDDSMSDAQKALAIHDWIVMNVTYDNALLSLFGSGQNLKVYNGFYLEGVFDDGIAVCDGISKAFAALCNIEGIPCVQVTGTSKSDGIGHAWNKVYIDGDWYIVDATSDGAIVGNYEVLTYSYFLIDDETMQASYTPIDFEEIVCSKTYAVAKLFVFESNGSSFDLYVESTSELDVVVAYFKTHVTANTTFEIYLAFNYGLSPDDEIAHSCSKCGLSVSSFSYILSGTPKRFFMFIK